MTIMTDQDKRTLLTAARSSIETELHGKSSLDYTASDVMKEKRGCFVTLHKHGELRGCIGIIEPVSSLIDGVKSNARHAAFKDSRFSPVQAEELSDIKIEISLLTVPKTLEYSDGDDLKAKLKPHVHGVILSKSWRSATFLPQVWEQLPDPELFLNHLCRKAGMGGDCWKKGDIQIKTYEVEHFSE